MNQVLELLDQQLRKETGGAGHLDLSNFSKVSDHVNPVDSTYSEIQEQMKAALAE